MGETAQIRWTPVGGLCNAGKDEPLERNEKK